MAVSQCPCLTLSNVMLDMPKSHWFLHYPSTHSTFNLIGPCNRHPNIQSHKDTYAQTTDIHGELNSNGELNNSERTSLTFRKPPFSRKVDILFLTKFSKTSCKTPKDGEKEGSSAGCLFPFHYQRGAAEEILLYRTAAFNTKHYY